jgi:acetolactate synthase-1/2/3 large subunit
MKSSSRLSRPRRLACPDRPLEVRRSLCLRQTYPGILAQEAIAELSRLTAERDTVMAVGVGQHQMWSAQFYKFREPRRWLSSSGLGTMGFGLPAAMGAAGWLPDAVVVDIDGDGSILMNIQEFATCPAKKSQ